MSKKRRKSRHYPLTGIIEVCYITRGQRKTCVIDLDSPQPEKIMEFSGSIVEKRPIYEIDELTTAAKKNISTNRSSHEG
jgi:hypothetical protein